MRGGDRNLVADDDRVELDEKHHVALELVLALPQRDLRRASAIARAVKDAANWTCQQCGAVHGQPHPTNGKDTVMTCAHLDHDEANCDPSNLRSLCAPCHLRYDAAHHAATAAATRRAKSHVRRMGMEI